MPAAVVPDRAASDPEASKALVEPAAPSAAAAQALEPKARRIARLAMMVEAGCAAANAGL
jgi:hypothetical protein